jgi:hypothetical protein
MAFMNIFAAGNGAVQDSILELHVELVDSEPELWRRFELRASLALTQVHQVLQAALGWEDAHLHRFATSDPFTPLRPGLPLRTAHVVPALRWLTKFTAFKRSLVMLKELIPRSYFGPSAGRIPVNSAVWTSTVRMALSPTLISLSFPIRKVRPACAEPGAAGTLVLPEGETEQADKASAPPAVVAAVPSSREHRGRGFPET